MAVSAAQPRVCVPSRRSAREKKDSRSGDMPGSDSGGPKRGKSGDGKICMKYLRAANKRGPSDPILYHGAEDQGDAEIRVCMPKDRFCGVVQAQVASARAMNC